MATSRNWSGSTEEHTNFARLCRLLIDGGTLVVKDVFDSIHQPKTLHSVLLDPPVHSNLKSLRTKRVLNTRQWNKLYPSVRSSVTSSSFDITLLFVLLRNICGLTPPATGWDKPPAAADTSREADLARIKWYRNELYGHITSTSISDGDFEKYWNDIEALLSRLSASRYQDEIKRLKVETMDPDDEKHFIKEIEEWEQFEQKIMIQLEEIRNMLKSTSTVADESRCKDYKTKLKSSIKSQTDFQPGLKEGKRIRTDDIFTNVTIQRGQKHLKKHLAEGGISRKGTVDEDKVYKGKDEDGSTHGHSILKKCSELFTFPVESDAQVSKEIHKTYPKSIQVTGQAGIGKTLFAQKLVRDWANDRLFGDKENTNHPDFQFVFLLTFRQLNLLEEEKLNLREVLNRSSLLNEQSNLDDPVFEYLLQNPEKLLLIIDGYDEYAHGDVVTGDSESKYPNDPREKMPIPVVVAKLMKGKILQDSVVMITSRPGDKVHDLRENFDVQVEVTGFSCSQVLEFVAKYFKDNESMKNTVLDHFRQHEGMLEFVHVPVICLLMCYLMEWHLTHSESRVNLPITRTDLYHEVTKVFIRKHHLHLKYDNKEEADRVVEKTLGKLAELAAKLLEKENYIFDEDDVSKMKFCKEDIDDLKTSGVLYCCPGTRKSPFAEVTQEYEFIHLTVQEYLAAYFFVEQERIPENSNDVVLQFMSGLLARKRNEKLMTKLLNSTELEGDTYDDKMAHYVIGTLFLRRLLLAKCLYEYGDMNVAKGFISEHFDEFCDEGRFVIREVSVTNYVHTLTFVLDAMAQLHEEQLQCSQSYDTRAQPFYVHSFVLRETYSCLTAMEVKQITRSLTNVSSTVTKLMLIQCGLKDDWVSSICELLTSKNCKLTLLDLGNNEITDSGVSCICKSLTSVNCKLTSLNLGENKITDSGVSCICELLSSENCKLTNLGLNDTEITDSGVSCICELLSSGNCKLSALELSYITITEKGVSSICKSLTSVNCKLTTLFVRGNKITDNGVSSICESLSSENCKLTNLHLSYNPITDKGVSSICESLTSENCKLTSLGLRGNIITDKEVSSIRKSLTSVNCKLTILFLGGNKITDKGVDHICASLTSKNCKLTTLDLTGNNKITDKGATRICQSVTHENCKLSKLFLGTMFACMNLDERQTLQNLVKQKNPDFELSFGF